MSYKTGIQWTDISVSIVCPDRLQSPGVVLAERGANRRIFDCARSYLCLSDWWYRTV
jgi:hypothetical protein